MEPVDDTGQLSSVSDGAFNRDRLPSLTFMENNTLIIGFQHFLISSLSSGNFCFIQKMHKDCTISAPVVLFTETEIHLHMDLMVLISE